MVADVIRVLVKIVAYGDQIRADLSCKIFVNVKTCAQFWHNFCHLEMYVIVSKRSVFARDVSLWLTILILSNPLEYHIGIQCGYCTY